MVSGWPASAVVPQRKPGDSAISAFELAAQRVADQLIHGAAEIAAAIEQAVGGGDFFVIGGRVRRAHLVDQRLHRRIRLQQFGEHRQQPVAHIGDLALGDLEIEHGEKFSVGAGIGHQRDAAGIFHCDRLRHGIVGVAAEDYVDAGDAAGELEIDVHAVMRQQDHRIDLVGVAQASTSFCSSSSRMPNFQSGVKRLGWAIGT